MKKGLVGLLLFAFICESAFANGQNEASRQHYTLKGTVTDQNGAALPGMLVWAEGPFPEDATASLTGDDGKFFITATLAGDYDISVEKDSERGRGVLFKTRIHIASDVVQDIRIKYP